MRTLLYYLHIVSTEERNTEKTDPIHLYISQFCGPQ